MVSSSCLAGREPTGVESLRGSLSMDQFFGFSQLRSPHHGISAHGFGIFLGRHRSRREWSLVWNAILVFQGTRVLWRVFVGCDCSRAFLWSMEFARRIARGPAYQKRTPLPVVDRDGGSTA